MKKLRIIPRLDIKGPNVVKGVHMEGLRVMGDPVEMAKKYYETGADEMLYMDIVASLYGRGIDIDLVKAVAKEVYVPLTVGGGIQSARDIRSALHAGADKVAINSYAVRNPGMLEEAVQTFGSQCIVLSIEAKQNKEGRWEVYTDGGREHSGRDVVQWAEEALSCGIGEILITSVDFDGTRRGFDAKLIEAVTAIASVPVIACGGAGTKETVHEILETQDLDAAAIATPLHYNDYTIQDLKQYLHDNNLPVRIR
jgi:cyclase